MSIDTRRIDSQELPASHIEVQGIAMFNLDVFSPYPQDHHYTLCNGVVAHNLKPRTD